jgi:hypothetical protein
MYQQAYKQISKSIGNWSNTEVRTVPGVMYQISCGNDEIDPNIEYQINCFIDCEETFIHNHKNSFVSLCLDGEYTESLWEVVDDGTGTTTYQFHRKSGNVFDSPTKIPGALRHVMYRSHFPGNQLHVNTEQYHSISPKATVDSQVFTFLAKRKHSPEPKMYILSPSPTINAPSDEIRPATEEERQKMYDKLQYILKTKLQQ